MSTPFLGEIKIMSFGFAPKGWAMCNGQLLPINQNQALFSILGTTYGGDGRVNFALPDMRVRTPIHTGSGHTLGERGGEEAHTLNISQIPLHSHALVAENSNQDRLGAPRNTWFAMSDELLYGPLTGQLVALTANVGTMGGNQAHNNTQPSLVLNFCIALQGIFPSRN